MKPKALPLVLLLVVFATARADDDLVLLTSGNRMTGEVEELARGELTFSIDGVGPVQIDWRNVLELHSTRSFHIELASGERYDGALTVSAGKLEMTAPSPGRSIETREVLRIHPVTATFAERLTGTVDLGVQLLEANEELDWTLYAQIEHRTRNYRSTASLSSLLRRADGDTSQRRNHLDVDTRRFLYSRWFAIARFEAEENSALGLDSRFLLGGGIGRTLAESQRTHFALYGGLDVDRDKFRAAGTDTLIEGFVGAEWDWFEVAGNTALTMRARTYFAPETSRRRFESDAALRRHIGNGYYWSLHLYQSYNSAPPEGFDSSDRGIAVTIGRAF